MTHGPDDSRSSYPRCGCVEGFAGLLIGLALFARHYAAAPTAGPAFTVLTAVAYALAGAAAGKAIGLTWPRVLATARGRR